MNPTPEQLEHELADFYGSEVMYRHGLNRNVVYTEGVQYLAERVGAYWLLDILVTEPAILGQARSFAAITLTVKDEKAVLSVTDGNDNQVYERRIDYTDFPAGEWKFFFTDGVLMLPGEY